MAENGEDENDDSGGRCWLSMEVRRVGLPRCFAPGEKRMGARRYALFSGIFLSDTFRTRHSSTFVGQAILKTRPVPVRSDWRGRQNGPNSSANPFIRLNGRVFVSEPGQFKIRA
ncbi:hypothetical protein PIB30_011303 [Stylosanthes scabra]|uniref:Uncharacterized protein n=1 Tax=Stylosanthes scabra TaxID=79078 RepID=A0ABU6V5B2_9FABA|nr:hypothetical protein [Stylosanthes scabra]